MTDRQPFLLSPYRPPTSYPVQLTADEAAAWLNGYAALWHPAALKGTARPPEPASGYDHDQPTTGAVYAVAEGPHLYQPEDWADRVKAANAVTFRATADRAETLGSLAAALRESGDDGPLLDLPADVWLLFAGVGYGHLMLDTLFDAMSHDRLLDAAAFWADVTAAVGAAERGDFADTRTHLQAAAGKLLAAREGLHGGTVHVLEWVMPDPADLGRPWPAAAAAGFPITLLAPGEALDRLAAEHPDRLAELKATFPDRADLGTGACREREDALLPAESQFWNLHKARAAAKATLGVEPDLYARKRSAAHPQLPSWLQHTGFRRAITAVFDGAMAPSRYAATVHWPAPDGKAVDCFARDPHPAGDPQTFFNLAYHLHQAIAHDSTPGVALLHRTGPPAAGYAELVALGGLAPVLGEWVTTGRHLEDTSPGDYAGAATPDEFFADYLDERVTTLKRPDPVSGFARHLRLRRRLDSALALAALHRTLAPPSAADGEAVRRVEELEDAVETRGVDVGPADAADELAGKVDQAEAGWAGRLAERVLARSPAGPPGLVVFNPFGFARRVALELDPFPAPIAVEGAVKAAQFDADKTRLVVEVPALGFAWVPRGQPATPPPKPRLKTAENGVVRNEFFEAEVDPATGGLRAFRDLRTRLNRLGQQLVFNPGSRMRGTAVRTTAGAALGEVVSEGEITDEHDAVLAAFRQRFRAWVGRPALEVRIEIEPRKPPAGYPWHAYYGARFGWRDERAALFRGANGSTAPTTAARPVSPDFLEVRLGGERTFLFTGGLPFVQKHAARMADVVLVAEGETATAFDLLLSLDREHPMQTAAGWTAPAPVVVTNKGPPPVGPSGWLGHIDLPSLLLTSLRPAEPSDGTGRAVSARFLETAGYGGAAELRFARDPTRAMMIDGTDAVLHEVMLAGDAVPLEFSAGEVIRVKAEWA